jgi:uracil-DNA glycosylase
LNLDINARDNTAMSLDLDDRQRAMLHEMGVHVWWPQVQVAAPVPDLAAPAQARATTPAQVMPTPPAVAAPLQTRASGATAPSAARSGPAYAPVKVADSAYSTRATALISSNLLPEGIASMDWLALQQAVANCTACKLCEGRKNTVFGAGQPATAAELARQVDWLLVGEAPGEQEDSSGEPFVGQAGQLLDNMLKAMGLQRTENVFIANVIKCRPPGNRNPEPQEIAQCEPYLRRQIELLQPKVIVALGKYAVTALLQASVPDVAKTPLGKLRGQVYGYQSAGRSVPVIATYHPAYLLRNLPEKARAWADLCLALDVMKRQ